MLFHYWHSKDIFHENPFPPGIQPCIAAENRKFVNGAVVEGNNKLFVDVSKVEQQIMKKIDYGNLPEKK